MCVCVCDSNKNLFCCTSYVDNRLVIVSLLSRIDGFNISCAITFDNILSNSNMLLARMQLNSVLVLIFNLIIIVIDFNCCFGQIFIAASYKSV